MGEERAIILADIGHRHVRPTPGADACHVRLCCIAS